MFLFIKLLEWWDKKKAREPGSIDWDAARADRDERERLHREQYWTWERERRRKESEE